MYEYLPNCQKKMTVQRGKTLDHVDMRFDFDSKAGLKITMHDHIKNILKKICDPLSSKLCHLLILLSY